MFYLLMLVMSVYKVLSSKKMMSILIFIEFCSASVFMLVWGISYPSFIEESCLMLLPFFIMDSILGLGLLSNFVSSGSQTPNSLGVIKF